MFSVLQVTTNQRSIGQNGSKPNEVDDPVMKIIKNVPPQISLVDQVKKKQVDMKIGGIYKYFYRHQILLIS